MNTLTRLACQAALVTALGLLAQEASAVSFTFTRIEPGNAGSENPAAQFGMDVTPSGTGVSFLFSNIGTIDSVITDIFWDDNGATGDKNNPGTAVRLDAVTSRIESTGVDFDQGSKKFGGNNGFGTHFNETAVNPQPDWGVGNSATAPGETLNVIFSLLGTFTAQDVIDALKSGDLRVGLHVQNIGTSGESDWFITDGGTKPSETPDGGLSAILLGLGFMGLAALARRRG